MKRSSPVCLRSNLVEIFPSEEGLVLLLVEVDGEGRRLGAVLPQRAGAVPRQRVVPHLVVVRVLTRQDAAPAGAAQRRDRELQRKREEEEKKGNRRGKTDDKRYDTVKQSQSIVQRWRKYCSNFHLQTYSQRLRMSRLRLRSRPWLFSLASAEEEEEKTNKQSDTSSKIETLSRPAARLHFPLLTES